MENRHTNHETGQPEESSNFKSNAVLENPSYQHAKPFILTDEICKAIDGAVTKIDREQIRILRTKTVAERVQMAASMIDAAEQVGAYRLRQREPELSETEALRIVRGGLMNYLRQKRKP